MRATFLLITLLVAACGGGGSPQESPAGLGTVNGTVVEPPDEGVAGAAVALTRAGFTTRNATTGATGSYAFAGVAAGSWTVTVAPPQGFTAAGPLTAQVQVVVNQTAVVPPVLLERQSGPPDTGPATITIGDNVFVPGTLNVTAPRVVRWVNSGQLEHNTTSATGVWSPVTLAPGAMFEREFTQPGTYAYSCTLHPGMNGTINVQ